jgi:phosphoribosylformylglycinamidine synthase subunit PurL
MVVVVGSGSEVSLAGSEYLSVVHGNGGSAGSPSRTDLAAEKKVSDLVRGMVRSGLIDTAHDISGGGEIGALAKMALAGGVGFEYDEDEVGRMIGGTGRADLAFVGEVSGRFVVAFPKEKWEAVENSLGEAGGVPYDPVGTVGGDEFGVGGYINLPLSKLKEAYERDLFE